MTLSDCPLAPLAYMGRERGVRGLAHPSASRSRFSPLNMPTLNTPICGKGNMVQPLAQRLTVQALIGPLREGGHVFALAEHLRPRFRPEGHDAGLAKQGVATPSSTRRQTGQVTEQVVPRGNEQVRPLVQLTDVQWTIVEHTDTPRTLNELLDITDYKQRPHFNAQHLEPLLDGRVLRMTVPDKPTSSKQQYVLTANGLKLKALLEPAGEQTATPEDQQTD